MFTLISLGTGVAWIYSLVATLLPRIFPPSLKDGEGMVAVYFEATAIIITLVILGQMLELLAHARTNGAIKELLTLVPTTALVLRDGQEVSLPLGEVTWETGSGSSRARRSRWTERYQRAAGSWMSR